MGLSIKNPEVERLARKLAKRDDISITEAIRKALVEKLTKQETVSLKEQARRRKAVCEIQKRVAKLPWRDDISEDEIMGYDEDGLPTQ